MFIESALIGVIIDMVGIISVALVLMCLYFEKVLARGEKQQLKAYVIGYLAGISVAFPMIIVSIWMLLTAV